MLQHHWFNPFTRHLFGRKVAVPLPSVKKPFPLSEKNALVMLYETKIHFVYRGIVPPDPVKMEGATAGVHRIKLYSESAGNSNHLFLPPNINRVTLVCLWDWTGVLKTSLSD